jgi:hypothetical protein
LGTTVAEGAFVLIDDFQSYSPGNIDGQSNATGTWTADSTYGVTTDPIDAANRVLAVVSNSDDNGYKTDSQLSIPQGATGTLFFRFRRGISSSHIGAGLSDVAAPGAWGDYESNLRSQGSNLDIRDGGSYVNMLGNVPTDEWVSVWAVVDNAADTTAVHVQSPTTYPAQQQVGSGDFRHGTADALETLFVQSGSGHGGPWYVDDVYLDTSGQNLTAPVPVAPPPVYNPVLVQSEDFEDSVADGFTLVDGNAGGSGNDGVWSIIDESGNHVYGQTNGSLAEGSGSRLGAYSLAAPQVDNFRLAVDLRVDDTNSYADAAIVFGWQDNENYYYTLFNKTGSANEVFRVESGSRNKIGATFDPNGGADGGFHLVEIERLADTGLITMSVDGLDVFETIDATFGSGRVGIGAFNDAASFDNFTLYSLEPQRTVIPEPATLAIWSLLAGLGMVVACRRGKR